MRPWESVPAPGPPLAAARVGRAWAHLTAGLEDDNPDDFPPAVGDVEGAGMSAIAERSGVGRESLKALAPGQSRATTQF
jgi:DNA-binding phage protein